MEIERKFLIKKVPDNISNCKQSRILQGYLSFEPEVRIRKKVCNYEKYFLTVKSSGGISREEYEIEISKETFEDLKKAIKGKFLSKRRYEIPIENNKIAEFDVYDDFSEKTVEVEFDSIEEAKSFIVPDWFGREISGDEKYKNKSLFKRINKSL